MRRIEVEEVVVTHRASWGKWPDTEDTDYTDVLAHRTQTVHRRGDLEIVVTHRFCPAYLGHLQAGERPVSYPVINNCLPPSQAVLDHQQEILRGFARECPVLCWDHAIQCFPQVLGEVADAFRLRILMHADDCPGSSEIKTFPVAPYFQVLYHFMDIWNLETGEHTADKYRTLGLSDCRHVPNPPSEGIRAYLQEYPDAFAGRLDAMREGSLPNDLLFVGNLPPRYQGLIRHKIFRGLIGAWDRFEQAGLVVKLFGHGMPDGIVPLDDPRGAAYPLGSLYASTRFGLNVAVSSLWNTRLMDLFLLGIPQIVYDPHGELTARGFVPSVHHICFDGSAKHLIAVIESWRACTDDLIEMIRRARAHAQQLLDVSSWTMVFTGIYHDYLTREAAR